MTKEELVALQPADIAKELNAAGNDKETCMAAFDLTAGDLAKAQVFWVKDKWIARGWGGYTSTKRTGNEAGDDGIGVGTHDPSKGYSSGL